MKKLATLGVVLSMVAGFVLLEASSAVAVSHRHRRNHRHNTVHCGPGTHRSGNKCVPDTTPTPVTPVTPSPSPSPFPGTFGGCPIAGNYNLQPCSISMTRTSPTTGSFSGTFTASGLPSSTSFIVTPNGSAACPMSGGGGPFVTGTGGFGGFGFSGPGSITFGLASAGCQPGSYPITLTSSGGAIFTAFLTTQLF